MNGKSDRQSMKATSNREPRSIYIYTEKFSEGEWHPFRVLKTLIIPGEDEYLLVESRGGNRLLIPNKHYHNYNIAASTTIQCRIDRINCSGRVFLEPEHPFYKPGNSYSFTIIERTEAKDRKGRSITGYVLKGDWDHTVHANLKTNEAIPVGLFFNGYLIRIRKSVLIMNQIRIINNC